MGKKWTPDEDQRLTELHEQYGKQWGVIAQKIQTRTASQVAARWEKCLDPSLTKGPFTPEEDQIITDYVKNNGPQNWPGLSELIKNRSPKQCRERWFNHLDPNVTLKPWTSEEDEVIFSSINRYGKKWSIIAKFLPGRTDNAIKNRWNSSISKRIVYGMNGMKQLSPDVSRRRLGSTKQTQNQNQSLQTQNSLSGLNNNMNYQNQQFVLQKVNQNIPVQKMSLLNQNFPKPPNFMFNNQMMNGRPFPQNGFNSNYQAAFQNQFIPPSSIKPTTNQISTIQSSDSLQQNKPIPHFKREAAMMNLQPIITSDPPPQNVELNTESFPQPPLFASPISIKNESEDTNGNENQQSLLSPFPNFSLNSPKSPGFLFSPTQMNNSQFSVGSNLSFTPIFSPSNDQNWSANVFK